MGLLFGITQGQVSEPELQEVIIDGAERRVPRPQHRGKQKRFYSGRKKRHAVKNVLIVGRRKVSR